MDLLFLWSAPPESVPVNVHDRFSRFLRSLRRRIQPVMFGGAKFPILGQGRGP